MIKRLVLFRICRNTFHDVPIYFLIWMQESLLLHLPSSTLLRMCSFLGIADLAVLEQVCKKRLNHFATDDGILLIFSIYAHELFGYIFSLQVFGNSCTWKGTSFWKFLRMGFLLLLLTRLTTPIPILRIQRMSGLGSILYCNRFYTTY